MRRSLARYSAPVSSVHAPSWADFTTTMVGFRVFGTHSGAPRAVAIVNGTLAAALGLGLRLWIAGLVLWFIGHMAAVWATKRDPAFVDGVRRHLRYPAHLET